MSARLGLGRHAVWAGQDKFDEYMHIDFHNEMYYEELMNALTEVIESITSQDVGHIVNDSVDLLTMISGRREKMNTPLEDERQEVLQGKLLFSQVQEYIWPSFVATLNRYKGNGNDLQKFVSSDSTKVAWSVANLAYERQKNIADHFMNRIKSDGNVVYNGMTFSDPTDDVSYKKMIKEQKLLGKYDGMSRQGIRELQKLAQRWGDVKASPLDKIKKYIDPARYSDILEVKEQKRLGLMNDLEILGNKYGEIIDITDLDDFNQKHKVTGNGHSFGSAFDIKSQTLYVSFPPLFGNPRDTEIAGGVKQNLYYKQVDYPYRKNGGKVAKQFLDMYDVHRAKILDLINDSRAKNVYFTGHSMGGGVATIAANDEYLKNFGVNIQVTTFGSPVVGDSKFVSNFDQGINYNRVIHSSDFVPHTGKFYHVTNQVWDLAPKGMNYVGYILGYGKILEKLDKKLGLIHNEGSGQLSDYLAQTHKWAGLDDAMDNVVNGGFDYSHHQMDNLVSYPRARAFYKLLHGKAMDIIDSHHTISAFIQYSNLALDKIKNAIQSPQLLDVLEANKRVLQKIGLAIGGKVAIKINSLTHHIDHAAEVLKTLTKRKEYLSQMTDIAQAYKERQLLFTPDDQLKMSSIDDFINIDGILDEKSSRRAGEEFVDIFDQNFDDIGKGFYDVVKSKVFGKRAYQNLEPRFDPRKMGYKNLEPSFTGRGAAHVNATLQDIAFGIRQKVAPLKELVTDFTNEKLKTKQYVNLDNPFHTKQVTILNEKFPKMQKALKSMHVVAQDFVRKKTGHFAGIVDIFKFGKGMELASDAIKANVRKLIKSILTVGEKFGFNKHTLATFKKVVAKEWPSLVGVGFEIYFTATEIEEDLERIDNEKEYVVWNGEPIFKFYNPEEYNEIRALQFIYIQENLESTGVNFDSFVNSWFGRLSSGEDGILKIDGIPIDDVDFDVHYQKNVIDIRGEGYEGDSKVLSVLKNVGIGMFNVAIDFADVGGGGSFLAGLTTAIIDEKFEQQAIDKKTNGFLRAYKFKVLNDTYREVTDGILSDLNKTDNVELKRKLIEYLELYANPGLEKGTVKALKTELLAAGISDEVLDHAANRIVSKEFRVEEELEFMVELGLGFGQVVIGGATFIPGVLANQFSGLLSKFEQGSAMFDQRKKASRDFRDVYDHIVDQYLDRYTSNDPDPLKKLIYSSDFYSHIKKLRKELNEKISLVIDNSNLTNDEKLMLQTGLYQAYSLQLKVTDSIQNPIHSAYRWDDDVKEVVYDYNHSTMDSLKSRYDVLERDLNDLIAKHKTRDSSLDEEQMLFDIKMQQIKLVLRDNGIDPALAHDFYNNVYLKKTREGEESIGESVSGKTEADFKAMGMGPTSIRRIIKGYGLKYDLANTQIRQQYFFRAKITDVFHDPTSIYKNDQDVIDYYQKNGIEIDYQKRLDKLIRHIAEKAAQDAGAATAEEAQRILDETVAKLQEQSDERLTEALDLANEEFKQVLKDVHDEFDEFLKTYNPPDDSGEFAQRPPDVVREAQEIFNTTMNSNIRDEAGQFDHGFADAQFDNVEGIFRPTGMAVPYSFEGGRPTLLMEEGHELTYFGKTNALAGGIKQGYWIGVIPNGTKPPINTLDNYFMAYHIESQEDEGKALNRFALRITEALKQETITHDVDYVEYKIAIYTLGYIRKYNTFLGMDIESSFTQNGLGATINMQMTAEDIDVAPRTGSLPGNLSKRDVEPIVIEEEIVNPLKRAADFAEEIGDDLMAKKFRKISIEAQDMKRVADEYIDALRKMKADGVNTGGLDRLILEKEIKTETIQEKYTKLLIESLGKPLIEFV